MFSGSGARQSLDFEAARTFDMVRVLGVSALWPVPTSKVATAKSKSVFRTQIMRVKISEFGMTNKTPNARRDGIFAVLSKSMPPRWGFGSQQGGGGYKDAIPSGINAHWLLTAYLYVGNEKAGTRAPPRGLGFKVVPRRSWPFVSVINVVAQFRFSKSSAFPPWSIYSNTDY